MSYMEHAGCHQLNRVLVVTPGCQIGYMDGHHTGCHRLNRVLTHNNNVVRSARPTLAVDLFSHERVDVGAGGHGEVERHGVVAVRALHGLRGDGVQQRPQHVRQSLRLLARLSVAVGTS